MGMIEEFLQKHKKMSGQPTIRSPSVQAQTEYFRQKFGSVRGISQEEQQLGVEEEKLSTLKGYRNLFGVIFAICTIALIVLLPTVRMLHMGLD